jgi:hypothetical protein
MKKLFIILFLFINSFIFAQSSQQEMISEIIRNPKSYVDHTFSLFDVKIFISYDSHKFGLDFLPADILDKDARCNFDATYEIFSNDTSIAFIIPTILHRYLKKNGLIYDEYNTPFLKCLINIKWLSFQFVEAPSYMALLGFKYFALIRDIEFENGLLINHNDYPFRF